MLVIVLLAVVQCATAVLPVFRYQDPLVIAVDDTEGFLYEVPEYEDPQELEHQLNSLSGGMPMFSLLDLARKHGESKDKDDSQKTKISESKKALEDIIYRLEATRSKLENGNSNIYVDLEKIFQGLKKLETRFRPDIRALFSSLRNLKPVANPVAMPNIMEIVTTTRGPALYDKSSIIEIPGRYKEKIFDVKVFSNGKPILDQHQVDEELVKESKTVNKIAKGKPAPVPDQSLVDEEAVNGSESGDKIFDVKVFSNGKPILDQHQIEEELVKESKTVDKIAKGKPVPVPDQSLVDEEAVNGSESGDKIPERDNKFPETNPVNVEAQEDKPIEISQITAAPFETLEFQKRGKSIDEDDAPALYQSKWTWNASRRLS